MSDANPHRLDKLRAVIKEGFSFFDRSAGTDEPQIFLSEVPTVMQYLGQFPVESDMNGIYADCNLPMDAGADAKCSYKDFEKMMLRLLMDHQYDPDDAEHLICAFKALDPENRGWIDMEVLRGHLNTNEKEFTEMVDFCPPENGRFYYEDYVAKLVGVVDNHLEKMYQAPRTGAGK